MTLSELATSMGLTVPQILARAVEVDAKFLCANPGSQDLSDEAEAHLRTLLAETPQPNAKKPEHDVRRRTQRGVSGARKKDGINHKGNRTVAALAEEYGVDTEELRQLALSLGYQVAEGAGSLSMAQVSQLLLRLNESAQISFGDTGSTTIEAALKNAGRLRDQPQSRKIRQSPNLRRTRLGVLTTQWDSSVAILGELCSVMRITIHDPESPRISNDDLLKLRAALQATTTVAERWGEQADVRLSKIATYCHVSLQELRKRCETLDVNILKRERVSRDDAVYLLVELGQVHHTRPDALSADVPENATGSVHDDSPSAKKVDLRLDGLELTDQDFSFEVLVGASFRGCELTRANFTGANLTGADFSGAILRYAVFEQALLDEALFDKADVRFANFAGVVLSEAQLASALVEGASFGGDARP